MHPGLVHARYSSGVRGGLFTTVAVVSLSLCVGVVALWVRSYWRADFVDAERVELITPNTRRRSYPSAYFSSRIFEMASQSGRLAAGVSVSGGSGFIDRRWVLQRTTLDGPTRPDHQFHVRSDYEEEDGIGWRWCPTVMVPHWTAAVVFAVVPVAWVRTRLRGRRRPPPAARLSPVRVRPAGDAGPVPGVRGGDLDGTPVTIRVFGSTLRRRLQREVACGGCTSSSGLNARGFTVTAAGFGTATTDSTRPATTRSRRRPANTVGFTGFTSGGPATRSS